MTESTPAAPSRRPPQFSLRVPTDTDAAAWFRLFNDPEVMRYISAGVVQPEQWYRDFVSRQQALAAWTDVCLFALVAPSLPDADADAALPNEARGSGDADEATPSDGSDEVAGFVGLQPWTRPWGPVGRIEIGWRLGVAFQGRGLATAGARAALERGRAHGIDSPIAMIDVQNEASIGVATKLGMHCANIFDAPDGARVGMWSF